MRKHVIFGLMAASALALAVGLARGSLLDWSAAVSAGVQVGAAVGAALAVLGYASMSYGLSRPNVLFLSIFYGGMLFRMFALGAVYLVASRTAALDSEATLLAMAGVYLPLLFVEVLFWAGTSGAAPQRTVREVNAGP